MTQIKETRRSVSNLNKLIQPLLTDKYQISMFYAYWRDSKHGDTAIFDLYFRRNPFKGEYTIFAGLDECLRYIESFKFSQSDIEYLKNLPDFSHVEAEFWDHLIGLDTSDIIIYSLHEGSVCFPNLPLMRLEGPLGLLQLIETTILNLVNYASLVCTNAARFKLATSSGAMPNCRLLEFGLRRAQGPDGAFSASRYSYIGGFDATSNLLAGKEYGIPVVGTMSHAFVMAYFASKKLERENISDHKFLLNKSTGAKEDFTLKCLEMEEELNSKNVFSKKSLVDSYNERSELKAFITFAWAFPDTFLALVDTYDVIRSGIVNFSIVAMALIHFGYKPIGIRIDSGDLAYLSKFAKSAFTNISCVFNMDEFDSFEIIASNDINEATINSLNDQKHSITGLGIGTHLVTCQNQPALGCVYKLVETNGSPCMKLSSMPEKTTIPCKKSAFRLYGKDGNALLDIVILSSEPVPVPGHRILCRHPFVAEKRCYATPSRVEPLLNLCWDGKRVQESFDLDKVRAYCKKSLGFLTDDIKRSLNPTPYKISVSEKLFTLLNHLKLSLSPIGELA